MKRIEKRSLKKTKERLWESHSRVNTHCSNKTTKTKRNEVKDKQEENSKKEEEKRKKIREQTKERVRKYREKNWKTILIKNPGLTTELQKKSSADKVKHALPSTPRKKAEIVKTFINSPRTRKVLEEDGLIKTPEEQKETEALLSALKCFSGGYFRRACQR